jgi:hypothetical protein
MKIKDGFILQDMGTSHLAVAVGDLADSFTSLVKLNSTGAFLWQKALSDTTPEALAKALVGAYGIDYDLAMRDTLAFVKILEDNGILDND